MPPSAAPAARTWRFPRVPPSTARSSREDESVRYTANLQVNGDTYPVEIEPGRSLLSVLRTEIGLTGSKEGCDDSECGACMVLLDGRPVNSCSYLAIQVGGRQVQTVEGLATGGELHPLQRMFLEEGGGGPSWSGGQPLPLHRVLGYRARRLENRLVTVSNQQDLTCSRPSPHGWTDPHHM